MGFGIASLRFICGTRTIGEGDQPTVPVMIGDAAKAARTADELGFNSSAHLHEGVRFEPSDRCDASLPPFASGATA